MAGIADKIKLYNEAYNTACGLLTSGGIRRADDNARLDKIIRSLIKQGHDNAANIASEALRYFGNDVKSGAEKYSKQ